MKEVFRLQNDQELFEAEKLYFQNENGKKAIILAASRGGELGELTKDKPKALLEVDGIPILKQSIDKMRSMGFNDISVVRGHKKERFPDLGCTYIDNDDYADTSELFSLYLAKKYLKGEVLIGYGDIVFRSYILNLIRESQSDITIIVDGQVERRSDDYVGDFVFCSREDTKLFGDDPAFLLKTKLATKDGFEQTPHGEWIGLIRTTPRGSEIMQNALEEMFIAKEFHKFKMGELFNHLLQKEIEIRVVYIEGHWMDIDNYKDFEKIQVF